MDIIEDMLTETCVYWPKIDDLPDGQPVYGSADELDCRWELTNELFLSMGGNQEVSQSRVYVGEDVTLNGVLRFGTLNQLADADVPFNNTGAYTIRYFSKIPTLDGDQFVRYALL